jgi:hypothetical protein
MKLVWSVCVERVMRPLPSKILLPDLARFVHAFDVRSVSMPRDLTFGSRLCHTQVAYY